MLKKVKRVAHPVVVGHVQKECENVCVQIMVVVGEREIISFQFDYGLNQIQSRGGGSAVHYTGLGPWETWGRSAGSPFCVAIHASIGKVLTIDIDIAHIANTVIDGFNLINLT